MQIKFKVGKFLEALDVVNLTVDKRLGTDTKDVYLLAAKKDDVERLYLYSTDFIAESIIKIDATVIEPGGFPLSPNQLYIALSKRDAEAEATLTITEDKALIKVGKSQFKLNSSRSQSLKSRLQAMPLKTETSLKMSADELINSLKKARTCVSTDINNPNKHVMRSINIVASGKSYVLNSTDGNVIAQIKTDSENDLGELNTLIPGEFTNTLLSLANKAKKSDNVNIEVILGDRLSFRSGDRMISTGILAGTYPNINAVINRIKPTKTVVADKTALKDVLDRVLGFSAFSSKEPDNIVLEILDENLVVKASSGDNVEETVEVTIEGDVSNGKYKLNGKKLLEIINGYSTGEIKLGFSEGPLHPIILSEEADKLVATYVVSQIR